MKDTRIDDLFDASMQFRVIVLSIKHSLSRSVRKTEEESQQQLERYQEAFTQVVTKLEDIADETVKLRNLSDVPESLETLINKLRSLADEEDGDVFYDKFVDTREEIRDLFSSCVAKLGSW